MDRYIRGKKHLLLAHLADIHLGKQQYGYEFRELDVYRLFDEAIDYIAKEHIKIVVISGDLFDEPRPRNRALKTSIDCLRKLCSKGVKVIVTPGDHDYPKRRDLMPLFILEDVLDCVKVLGVATTTMDRVKLVDDSNNLTVYAIPYIPFKRKARELVPKFLLQAENFFKEHSSYNKVLVGHYSIQEYLPYDAVLKLGQLPYADYIAFGHIHDRIKTVLPNGGVLSYPGSIDIYRVDEIPGWKDKGKGFNIVDLSIKHDPSMINWVNLSIRPQIIVKTTYKELSSKLKQVDEEIKEYSIKPAIIHLTVVLSKTTTPTTIRDLVYRTISPEDAVIRLSIEFREELESSVEETESTFYDEIDVLAKYMKAPRNIAELVINLVNELNSENPSKEEVEGILLEIVNSWNQAKEIVKLPEEKIVAKEEKPKHHGKGLLEYI